MTLFTIANPITQAVVKRIGGFGKAFLKDNCCAVTLERFIRFCYGGYSKP